MFTKLNQSAHSFFSKIILLFLVGTFVLWGIGDIFRGGGGAGTVATVGKTSISVQEYQAALRSRQDELRQMLGANYKPELIRQLNLEGHVLASLINDVLRDKEAAAIGLEVSDEEIIRSIRNNPQFQGTDGHFSKPIYQAILRSRAIGEKSYIANLRKDLAAELLSDTFTSGVVVPESLVRALYTAREEQRSGALLLVPVSALASVTEPSEQEIKTYYEAHAAQFSAPSYRTVKYVELKLSDVQSRIHLSEEEIKRAYADRSQDAQKPEKRLVDEMLFDNEIDAQAAYKKLTSGVAFDAVAQSAPLLNKGKTSLGYMSRDAAPESVSDEIFALKEGQSTSPALLKYQWTIFHVSKIAAPSQISYAELRSDIAKDLSARESQETIYKLVGNFEDNLASGASFESAAQKIGQSVHTIGPFTREGFSPDGKKLVLPPYENFITTVFSTNEKEHSQAMQASDGSYYVVYVDTVTPEHVRPLAEVKNETVALLKREKAQSMLHEAADDIAMQLSRGKKLADILAGHHLALSPVISGKLQRTSKAVGEGPLAGKALPPGLVAELFRLKPDQVTHAYPLPGGDYMIASLSTVTPAPSLNAADTKVLQPLREELKKTLGNEIFDDYFAYLRGKYNVSVNESALHLGDEETRE